MKSKSPHMPALTLGLAASDGGMAHVYAYPNGHPCEGGTCQQGECVP